MVKGVAIVGCGLIGNKRAKALGDCKLVAAADVNLGRAKQLAAQYPGCVASADWHEVVTRADVDLVVVATTNDMLTPVSIAAVQAGKHVLVEKPAARSAEELRGLVTAAKKTKVIVKAGFNHRFHPALIKAKEIFDSGELGDLMFIRGRYGHGGRLGMEREWRADPKIAGGGEMLDQGVHLIDLARWFAGDFAEVSGFAGTFFWNMPVDDNGFAMLRTAGGVVAWLHASCSEWKNLFSLEIYGKIGKLQVDGLGGSYGVERLTWYRMLPEMGPPETTSWEYPFEDRSWHREFSHMLECIAAGKQPSGNIHDAMAAMEVVQKIYDASRRNK
jgi:predicted dehydrogenase